MRWTESRTFGEKGLYGPERSGTISGHLEPAPQIRGVGLTAEEKRSMKKTILASLLAAFAISFTSGCASGPNRVTYTWNDWRDQKYSENAWLHGALLQDIIPVYGFVGFIAAVGDVLIFNPVQFWGTDAWDNTGTVWERQTIEGNGRKVSDISFDNGKDE